MIPDRWVYMAVNIGVFIVPFIFSFHPKLHFIKTWKAFVPAVLLTGSAFIIWDIVFTDLHVWSFNNRFVLGYYIFNLPVEEWLFFFCIPYACMFTHFCLAKTNWQIPVQTAKYLRYITSIVLLIIAAINHEKLYTTITFGSCALLLLSYPLLNKQQNSFGKFIISYSILTVPFLISNGILTGSGLDDAVVKYNSDHILNIRAFTIPCEDFIYGLMLILTNILVYEKLQHDIK
jgi:lycopene cyclase domain-containing protein